MGVNRYLIVCLAVALSACSSAVTEDAALPVGAERMPGDRPRRRRWMACAARISCSAA